MIPDSIDRTPPADPAPSPPPPGAAFFTALAFLTRIPLPRSLTAADAASCARAPLWFPLVGAILGMLLALAYLLLAKLLSPVLACALVVALWVVLSGALHLDGLCDTFDALMGGRDRESALRILRDPRAGTAGVVAIVLVLWIKLVALGSLPADLRVRALVLAPVVGRAWLVPALASRPARSEGLAQRFRGPDVAAQAVMSLASAAGACWLMLGSRAWLPLAASALPVAWLLYTARRRFGGVTGDVCGAAAELAEVFFLIAACSAAQAPGAAEPLPASLSAQLLMLPVRGTA